MKKIPLETITLPESGTWSETRHQFDQASIDAIETAYLAKRPLLIRGETGSGKSQLARAVAHVWGRLFVSEVVNSRTESRDLHYHFDAVARLADAQVAGAICHQGLDEKKATESVKTFLRPEKYLSPAALWWVFDWEHASKVYKDSEHKQRCIIKPIFKVRGEEKTWQPKEGAVILVDEIDKAETDLPNDLLETLGNGAFMVPWFEKPIRMQTQNPPLVMITTNDERELPAAFVRRCVVLNLNPPKEDIALKQWLVERGKVHFNNDLDEAVYEKAADLLITARKRSKEKGVPPVGQAEYIDLLRALDRRDKSDQIDPLTLLEKISPYVYQKYPEMVD